MQIQVLDPLEKLAYVVDLIAHKMALTPKGERLCFGIDTLQKGILDAGEIRSILSKLEKEHKAIELYSFAGQIQFSPLSGKLEPSPLYILKPKRAFPKFSAAVKEQLETLKKAKAEEEAVPSFDRVAANGFIQAGSPTQSVCIQFEAMQGVILLNESFLIAKPVYDSENYRLFEYLWNNPNRDIPIEEIDKALPEPLKKTISKSLENLNFRGALKDAFFRVTKNCIHFTPTRSIEELKAANLYPLRLFSASAKEKS